VRLDLFLKTSRLVKRRSLARELCDSARVQVNGSEAKPAKEVRPGDRIRLALASRTIELVVLTLPAARSRTTAETVYRVISDERTEQSRDLWNENP
jgi:ribosomal 50S subunit-recycling heat shock protein